MTYAAEAGQVGRDPITVCSLKYNKCVLTYGVGACTASGGSGAECYNTRATCQDEANYTGFLTGLFYFCTPPAATTLAGFSGQTIFPMIESVQFTAPRLSPGEGLGALGSVRITCRDFPYSDIGLDPYYATRTYNADSQGSFWGKILARWPYWTNAPLTVATGYRSGTYSSDFIVRNYIVTDITGPDANGQVIITAKDLLAKTDPAEALCPPPTTGRLTADLAAGTTASFTIDAGGSDYDSTGWARIGDEVILYGSRSGNVFSTLGRGAFGTTASDHDEGERVQLCKRYLTQGVVDVIEDLLTTYAGISATYVDTAYLDPDGFLDAVLINATITEPVAVNQLIREILEIGLGDLWFDEILQKFRLAPLAPPPPNATVVEITDDNILQGSLRRAVDTTARVSRYWLDYGERNPTDSGADNYAAAYLQIDTDSEDSKQYGSARQRVLSTRWLDDNDSATVLGAISRVVELLKDPPRRVSFSLDAAFVADNSLRVGSDITINSRIIQGEDGANLSTAARIAKLAPGENPGHDVAVEAVTMSFTGRYAYITLDSQVDYGSASAAEKAANGFIAPNSGNFADGGAPYKVI